jgi:hypothetical protein
MENCVVIEERGTGKLRRSLVIESGVCEAIAQDFVESEDGFSRLRRSLVSDNVGWRGEM